MTRYSIQQGFLFQYTIATQAATALAALHNGDGEGQATVAHTDINPGQFIKVGNRYKLSDFNRARLLRWNVKKNKACGYKVGRNPGTNRSPEEYKYQFQSEKVRQPAGFPRLVADCVVCSYPSELAAVDYRLMFSALGTYSTCYCKKNGHSPMSKKKRPRD